MLSELEQFYEQKTEPIRGCLLALRRLILEQDPLISETRKYGMPCFCYKKKAFCYLWIEKNTGEPYILMVEGKLLDYPYLEAGSRARMKILRVNAHVDLDVERITEVLQLGLELYRNGTVKA